MAPMALMAMIVRGGVAWERFIPTDAPGRQTYFLAERVPGRGRKWEG